MGTLLAVYLSTSDEAVPILLAQPEQFPVVIKILSLKFLIGMLAGIFIDFFIKKPDADDCFCSDCHQHTPPHQHHHHTTAFPAIVSHSIKKTLQIFVFLFVSMFVLTWIILLVGQQQLEEILSAGSALQPFVCSLIGLIPTCVPSILITQLLAADIIPFGSAMAGLCASSGMGLLLLLKENRDPRRTLLVLALLYLISAFTGLLLNGISLL